MGLGVIIGRELHRATQGRPEDRGVDASHETPEAFGSKDLTETVESGFVGMLGRMGRTDGAGGSDLG